MTTVNSCKPTENRITFNGNRIITCCYAIPGLSSINRLFDRTATDIDCIVICVSVTIATINRVIYCSTPDIDRIVINVSRRIGSRNYSTTKNTAYRTVININRIIFDVCRRKTQTSKNSTYRSSVNGNRMVFNISSAQKIVLETGI